MPVKTNRNSTTLTCGQCRNATLSIQKREVPGPEWQENAGWKMLRERAWQANWRVSAAISGSHYCPKCIAEYDY